MNFGYKSYGITHAECNGRLNGCCQIELSSSYLPWSDPLDWQRHQAVSPDRLLTNPIFIML